MTEIQPKKRILISGGSGLLGRAISELALKSGFEAGWLSRDQNYPAPKDIRLFGWNPASGTMDTTALEWADIVINLAGKSIGETPWNRQGKIDITESRLQAVATLVKGLEKTQKKLDSFIGVSGSGIYGPGNQPYKESEPPGKGFPAQVAALWENAYSEIPPAHYHKLCILRLGVVLSTRGGAMPKIMQPIRWGVGAALGSGKQGFNWIHIEDAARGFLAAREWSGVFNLSAPGTADNRQATLAIAKAMGRKIFFPPVPAFFLELALGERARLLTEGNYSDVSEISRLGFTFLHPDIKEAAAHLIRNQI
jgi:uncharacterized protein (TIGR01777 family)